MGQGAEVFSLRPLYHVLSPGQYYRGLWVIEQNQEALMVRR